MYRLCKANANHNLLWWKVKQAAKERKAEQIDAAKQAANEAKKTALKAAAETAKRASLGF